MGVGEVVLYQFLSYRSTFIVHVDILCHRCGFSLVYLL